MASIMRKYFLSPLFLLLLTTLSALAAENTFYKKYSNPQSTCGYSIARSQTGASGIAGLRFDPAGTRSIFFASLDASGKMLSLSSYSTGRTDDTISAIAPGIDGGYVLAASSAGTAGDRNILVFKVATDGRLLWKKTLSSPAGEVIRQIASASNGYVLVGTTDTGDDHDVLAIKIDGKGALVWSKSYGDAQDEFGNAVAVDKDDSIVISATRDGSAVFLKLDRTGKLLWHRQFSSIRYAEGSPSIAIVNDGYYVTGTSPGEGVGAEGVQHSDNSSISITKIGKGGKVLWSRNYSSNLSLILWHSAPASSNGAVISAQLGVDPVSAVLFRVDGTTGNLTWSKELKEKNSIAFSSTETPDGGLLATGCVGGSILRLFALKIDAQKGTLNSACASFKTPVLDADFHSVQSTTYGPGSRVYSLTVSTPSLSRQSLSRAEVNGCTAR